MVNKLCKEHMKSWWLIEESNQISFFNEKKLIAPFWRRWMAKVSRRSRKGDFYRLQTCDLRAWAPKIWSEVSVNRPNSKNAPACSWMSSKALIKVNILKTLAKHAQIFVINSRRPPIWCQSHRRSCILRFNKSTSMSSEKITCKCLLIFFKIDSRNLCSSCMIVECSMWPSHARFATQYTLPKVSTYQRHQRMK